MIRKEYAVDFSPGVCELWQNQVVKVWRLSQLCYTYNNFSFYRIDPKMMIFKRVVFFAPKMTILYTQSTNRFEGQLSEITAKKKGDLDTKSVEQMKYYHEIAIKIKSIPSWPFSLSEKISILLGVIVLWVLQGADYLI